MKLVLPEGECVEVELGEARKYSEQYDLDLVEVSNGKDGQLPVCKLLDFGKLKYEENKKSKHNIVQNKNICKEIRTRFTTEVHDLNVKNEKIKEFLGKKHKVIYVMELRGREINSTKQAEQKVIDNIAIFADIAVWDKPVVSKNDKKVRITAVLSPK